MPPRFLAVIPAYNEAATIGEVARKARRHLDVCVVNDASTDATAEIARSVEGVHVISHERNTHLARAILDGTRWSRATTSASRSTRG
jgi:glycosyltransferase involved in cell wall biosynthesis